MREKLHLSAQMSLFLLCLLGYFQEFLLIKFPAIHIMEFLSEGISLPDY